jgi:hypothetical protein
VKNGYLLVFPDPRKPVIIVMGIMMLGTVYNKLRAYEAGKDLSPTGYHKDVSSKATRDVELTC